MDLQLLMMISRRLTRTSLLILILLYHQVALCILVDHSLSTPITRSITDNTALAFLMMVIVMVPTTTATSLMLLPQRLLGRGMLPVMLR